MDAKALLKKLFAAILRHTKGMKKIGVKTG